MRVTDPGALAVARNHYVMSPDAPTLEQISEKFGIPMRTLERYSAKENWPNLRRAFWLQMTEQAAREQAQKSRQAAEKALEEEKGILKKALELIRDIIQVDPETLEKMGPGERARLAVAGARALPSLITALSLVEGGPTERVEQGANFYLSESEKELLNVPGFLTWLAEQAGQRKEGKEETEPATGPVPDASDPVEETGELPVEEPGEGNVEEANDVRGSIVPSHYRVFRSRWRPVRERP